MTTRVAGSLFDTGAGYPAALFGGEHRIHGRTYELVADTIERCLELLDEEEGAVDGLYHRIARAPSVAPTCGPISTAVA